MLAMAKPGKRAARQNVRHAADVIDPRTGELLAEAVDIEDPNDSKRKERVRRAATPLRRLHHKGRISDEAFDAGRRFNEAYAVARMGPRYCGTNADRIMVDVGVRNPEQLTAFNIASEECAAAIEHMGELGGSLLECVVGQELSVDEWVTTRARMNRWGQGIDPTSAGWVLQQVLGALPSWYASWD